MKREISSKAWLLISMLIFLLLIVLTISFFVLRPALNRFSMDFYYPVFKLTDATTKAIVDQSLLLENKIDLAAAIKLLQEQNDRLSVENAAMAELKAENESLRVQLNIPERTGFKPVFAQIMLRDPVTWQTEFTIDQGENAGVNVGDLVVTNILNEKNQTATVAVGRIKAVTNHTAVVITLANPDCQLSAYLPNSGPYGVHGVTTGTPEHSKKLLIRLQNLPRDGRYSAGDSVTTSKMSLLLPADILLGTLAETPEGSVAVSSDGKGLSVSAMMVPAADYSRLRIVAVMTHLPTGEAE